MRHWTGVFSDHDAFVIRSNLEFRGLDQDHLGVHFIEKKSRWPNFLLSMKSILCRDLSQEFNHAIFCAGQVNFQGESFAMQPKTTKALLIISQCQLILKKDGRMVESILLFPWRGTFVSSLNGLSLV